MVDSFQACGFSEEEYSSGKVKGKFRQVSRKGAKAQRKKKRKDTSDMHNFAPLRLCGSIL